MNDRANALAAHDTALAGRLEAVADASDEETAIWEAGVLDTLRAHLAARRARSADLRALAAQVRAGETLTAASDVLLPATSLHSLLADEPEAHPPRPADELMPVYAYKDAAE